MFPSAFDDFVDRGIAAGQQRLADDVRTLVYSRDPALCERLDFDDDRTFLEPMLFARLSTDKPGPALEQVLFAAIPEVSRPARTAAVADALGVVYVPRIGSWTTDIPGGRLELVWNPASRSCMIEQDGAPLAAVFQPIPAVADGCVEVLDRPHPLLTRLFVNEREKAVEVEIAETSRRKLPYLERAWEHLARLNPRCCAQLLAATRGVVVFHGDDINSFASMAAHGLAFLNAAEDDDEIFFIEDLAHQCGHLAFNALTYDTVEYLAVAAETPLRAVTGRKDERRTVYEAFHGVFTEAMMFHNLDACLASGDFSPRQEHELVGRLAFILCRWGADLHNLGVDGLFTPTGAWLLSHLAAAFKGAYEARRDLLGTVDLSGQPYNFSYTEYAARNEALAPAA